MGARIVKPQQDYHAMRVVEDARRGELLVVGRSKRGMYLWVGPNGSGDIYTFSGQATLRKLALQILEIVGETP